MNVYYFDRIRIHSSIHYKVLSQMIDTEELKGQCREIIINKPRTILNMRGYYGRIELFQATDEAIRMLQRYDLGRHTISYVEVDRDRVCNNSLASNKLKEVFQSMHYLKWGKGAFTIGDTGYIGKGYGMRRNMYVRCYVPTEDKIKLGNKDVVHIEFSLYSWDRIKSKFGICSIYEMPSAEHCYRSLADKYLVKGTLNQSRMQKHFTQSTAKNVNEFVPVLAEKKKFLKFVKNRNNVHMILRNKLLHKFTRSEQLIMNQGAGYWIKPKTGSGGLI